MNGRPTQRQTRWDLQSQLKRRTKQFTVTRQ